MKSFLHNKNVGVSKPKAFADDKFASINDYFFLSYNRNHCGKGKKCNLSY